jgi:cysteinyl-tRNA synthetase
LVLGLPLGRKLILYNTMSRRKEPLRPRDPPRVTMFVCGPTVQSDMHLGHARTYIFFDALTRYLRHLGYDVFYLMNLTDIDERVTTAARRAGEDPLGYSERMISSLKDDFGALDIGSISRLEPVSRHVDEMVREVESLVEKGFAYRADGWVYFDTTKFPRWGRLSHQSKSDLALRPLELSPRKRNLNDFALWRPEVLVDGRWNSPWGQGSPGWHIQDTAVVLPILGPQYDIHGGAYELVYPHHEAEIAQAESLTGARPLVRHWVHTNLLREEGLKMSKSLGNVVTVKDALRSWSADELRFEFLSVHYRKGSDLSGLPTSRRRLRAMRRSAKRFAGEGDADAKSMARFEDILNDDFDSPGALRWVERTLSVATEETDRGKAAGLARAAMTGMRILGIDLLEGS